MGVSGVKQYGADRGQRSERASAHRHDFGFLELRFVTDTFQLFFFIVALAAVIVVGYVRHPLQATQAVSVA